MRITLVTHYFPPEVNAPAQRAWDHARIWTEAGHQVTIVTAQPSHPYGRIYDGFENGTTVATIEGIRVVRLRTFLAANAGKVKRSLNYLSFMLAVWFHARRLNDTDVVISTSPQFFCGLSGKAVARAAKVPWVLEIRDVWPDSIVAVGVVRPSLATRLLTALADRAYRQCDGIVSVSPGFNQHFRDRGVPEQKIVTIPNGVRPDDRIPGKPVSTFPELSPIAGRTICSYVGTFGMAHGAETILRAAELLKSDPRIGFLLVGSGAERERLLALKERLALDNVVILDQQPRERIVDIFDLTSVSIVHLKKQAVFKTVIPTKLLEGMAMAKPVVLGVEGVAKDILEAGDGGIAVEPENPAAMAEALSTLVGNPERVRSYGESGRAYVQREYDRGAMGRRYVEVLDRLIGDSLAKASA